MNRIRLPALVAVVAILVVAGALFWRARSEQNKRVAPVSDPAEGLQNKRVAPANPWGCLPPAGAELAWRVGNSSRYDIDPAAMLGEGATGGVRSGQREMAGLLRATVQASEAGGRLLWMALLNPVVSDNGKVSDAPAWREMSRPIAVELAANCGVSRIGFGAGTGPRARNEWRLLLGLLDIKAGPAAGSWQVRQRDPTGTYVARYDRTDAGGKAL